MKSIKENLLLYCPIFMNYEKLLQNELGKNFNVTFIDHALYFNDFINTLRIPFLRKHYQILFKLFPSFFWKRKLSKSSSKYYDLLNYPKDTFSTILVIKADKVSKDVIRFIREKNPNAKMILYEWDDVRRLLKHDFFEFFDKKYSFNIQDCKKYNFNYLPMFSDTNFEFSKDEKKYDISVICGYSKYKIKIIKKLYEKNKNKYNFFIYIYDPHKQTDFFSHQESLPFNEYMKIVSESKCLLDLPHKRQHGPTTRCTDVIACKTKIISPNKYLRLYPFYNKNYFIIDKSFSIPEDFVKKDYEESNFKCVDIETWVNEILQ